MTRHHRHHRHEEHHRHEDGRREEGSARTDDRGDREKASSDKYGVWVGTPLSYTGQTLQQDKSPHITLKFDDGSGNSPEANINVASTSGDTNLVYWMDKNWTHPVTKTIGTLSEGFHQATTTDGTGLSLDFLRTTPALVDFSQGKILQDDDSSNTSTDILDQIEPIIKAAISAKSKVYIFGRDYGTGIDDIHMNQGNTGDYENEIGKDGALIFESTSGGYEAIFFAFAQQEIPTDNTTGAPTSNAKALDTIVASGTSSSN